LLSSKKIDYGVQVDFKPSVSNPVIGLTSTADAMDLDNISFEFNEMLVILWFIGEQRLMISGKMAHLRMPRCNGGAILRICVDERKSVTFIVLNPGEKKESLSMSIQNIPRSLFPFVGTVKTGSMFVSFQLMESAIELATPENVLVDVTKDTHIDKVYGNMHILSDGKRFTRTSTEQGNSCVLFSRKITKGKHRWSIRVLCDFGASLCVGLARYPFKLSEDYVRDPLKHIYRHPGLLLYRSYRGLLYMDGRQLDRSLQPLGWQHNSTVTLSLEVDMDKRTIEVFRNGKSLGIAFSDISGPLQPVICFYASYEKEIEFISYETTEAGDFHSQPTISEVYQSTSANDIPQEIKFDQKMKYGSLTLSSDRTSISRDRSQSGNAYCLMNLVCKTVGVYRFSFVIETDQGASVCIGVTDVVSPTAIRRVEIGNIYLSPSLYLYRSFQGMLYMKGRELTKRFDEFWMSGTLVEMTIDIASNEAVVQYTVNGKDQGIAFAGLKPPLRPLIAIYAGMEKRVTLIHFEHVPKFLSPLPMTSSTYNDINTSATYASRTSLPTVATPLDTEKPSSQECMVCGRPADVILLPCQHSMLCAQDSLQTSHCIICNQRINGFWNILSMKQ
jgi:hypothetical protein